MRRHAQNKVSILRCWALTCSSTRNWMEAIPLPFWIYTRCSKGKGKGTTSNGAVMDASSPPPPSCRQTYHPFALHCVRPTQPPHHHQKTIAITPWCITVRVTLNPDWLLFVRDYPVSLVRFIAINHRLDLAFCFLSSRPCLAMLDSFWTGEHRQRVSHPTCVHKMNEPLQSYVLVGGRFLTVCFTFIFCFLSRDIVVALDWQIHAGGRW